MPLEEKAKTMLGASDEMNESKSSISNINEMSPNTDEVPMNETAEKEEQHQINNEQYEGETSSSETHSNADSLHEPREFEKLTTIEEKLSEALGTQKELESKVIQTLKENANFQIQVRQNMQKELEDAKKKLSGDIFIPLLKEIAELYIEWQDVLTDMEDGIAKRKVNGIFEVLQEMLEEYGCEFGISDIDSKRKTKYSKLKNKVLTGDKEKHETVAKSHNPWIVKEPFVLYPEYVDVYVFDSSCACEGNTKSDDVKFIEKEENITQEEDKK